MLSRTAYVNRSCRKLTQRISVVVAAYNEPQLLDRVRYVWDPQLGFRAGPSRNNGIRLANGDLLAFIHGGLRVRPDSLSGRACVINSAVCDITPKYLRVPLNRSQRGLQYVGGLFLRALIAHVVAVTGV